MKIDARGLALSLSPSDRLNDEDWCRVRVAAKVPGFEASLLVFLQGADLDRFRNGVNAMYANVGKAAEARLTSIEPGISLTLSMGGLGGIAGTYKLEGEFLEGGAPKLTGGFQMDQSYLPAISDGIDKLLAALRGA
jgi:hypothetical protein